MLNAGMLNAVRPVHSVTPTRRPVDPSDSSDLDVDRRLVDMDTNLRRLTSARLSTSTLGVRT